jgi:transcription antitermination factor NusG
MIIHKTIGLDFVFVVRKSFPGRIETGESSGSVSRLRRRTAFHISGELFRTLSTCNGLAYSELTDKTKGISAKTIPQSAASPFPWYAVHTRFRRERIAATSLASKGYEPYLPTYRTRRCWSDRVIHSDQPLFPGYVFCRFDFLKRLPILTTPGVVSVLGFGSEPAPIPEPEMEAVHRVHRSGREAEPCTFLSEGQRVRVHSGSLRGLEGILLKNKSKLRIVVSIRLLQRSISVEIDRESIASV